MPGTHRRSAETASPSTTRVLLGLLAAGLVAVVVGLVLLWPHHRVSVSSPGVVVHGQVVARTGCAATSPNCVDSVQVRLADGTRTQLSFTPGPTDPDLRVGDHISLGRSGSGANAVYQFNDIDRGRPLLLLAVLALIVLGVVALARGLAAVAGLVVAGTGVVVFVLPALLAGESPLAVTLVAGVALATVVLPLTHGVSRQTLTALVGTVAGLVIAAVVADVSVDALRLTGLSSDESSTLQLLGSRASVSGLVLAGIVIGALGALNDVTVSQASAVFEIAEAGGSGLFRSGMRLGRQHIASTVYSLVFAYTGSSLPLLLLFSINGRSVADVLTSDAVVPELAAGLIGCIALTSAVPITTALAARTARP